MLSKFLFGGDVHLLRDRRFQVLLLPAMISPFGNALLSPILDSLIQPFGATPATIGWMLSVFWAPAILVIPLAGMISDRWGRKMVLIPSLVLFGLSGAAIALTTDFLVILGLRFLQGIGWSGLVPVVVTSVGDLYSGPTEATAQGFRLMGTALTGATISLAGGGLVVIGWQYPFLLYLLALPVAVLIAFRLDEPTRSEAEPSLDDQLTVPYQRAILELVRQPRVFAIVIARFLPTIAFIGFITYNSVVVIRLLDGTPVQAGVLFAVMNVLIAAAASQAGRIAVLFGSEYPPLALANVAILVGFGFFFVAPGVPSAILGVSLLGMGMGLSVTLYRSLLTGFAPASLRGGLVSIGASGDRMMGAVTPFVMGVVIGGLTPVMGFGPALQYTGVGAAVVGGGGGIICVLAAYSAPPTDATY